MGGDVSVDTNSGDITGASGGTGDVSISYSGIENLNLAGGIANLTLTTTAADDTLTVTPGLATTETNTGTLNSTGALPQIIFSDQGTVTADLSTGNDAVVVNGSSGNLSGRILGRDQWPMGGGLCRQQRGSGDC
jgi:hypothetical protein